MKKTTFKTSSALGLPVYTILIYLAVIGIFSFLQIQVRWPNKTLLPLQETERGVSFKCWLCAPKRVFFENIHLKMVEKKCAETLRLLMMSQLIRFFMFFVI